MVEASFDPADRSALGSRSRRRSDPTSSSVAISTSFRFSFCILFSASLLLSLSLPSTSPCPLFSVNLRPFDLRPDEHMLSLTTIPTSKDHKSQGIVRKKKPSTSTRSRPYESPNTKASSTAPPSVPLSGGSKNSLLMATFDLGLPP